MQCSHRHLCPHGTTRCVVTLSKQTTQSRASSDASLGGSLAADNATGKAVGSVDALGGVKLLTSLRLESVGGDEVLVAFASWWNVCAT